MKDQALQPERNWILVMLVMKYCFRQIPCYLIKGFTLQISLLGYVITISSWGSVNDTSVKHEYSVVRELRELLNYHNGLTVPDSSEGQKP